MSKAKRNPIKYVLEKRTNPQHNNSKEHYYARGIGQAHLSGKRLAELIAGSASLTSGDCYSVWSNMLGVIAYHLSSGTSVEVPYLGKFYVTVKSGPIPAIPNGERDDVWVAGPFFRPCKEFLDAVDARAVRVPGGCYVPYHEMPKKEDRLKILLGYLQNNPSITRAKYQELTHASQSTARDDIRTLVNKKKITMKDKGSSVYYELRMGGKDTKLDIV